VRRALGGVGWAALLGLAFVVDRRVHLAVGAPEGSRAPVIEGILALLKRMGEGSFVVVVGVTMLVLGPARRGQVLALGLAVAVAFLVGQALLKPAIGKLRPGAELTAADVERLVAKGGSMTVAEGKQRNDGSALFLPPFSGRHRDLAFPSGHAALAFAAFTVLGRAFPRGRWWFLLLACAVAASRVLVGEHFLSDVVAGGGVGYACARAILFVPAVRRWMAVTPPPARSGGTSRSRGPA
jgi:membrane-associated phospholipid phosphatase